MQKIVTEIEARSEEATFEQEGIPIVEASISYPAITYRGFQKNAAVLTRFSDTYYLPEGRFLRLRDLFRPRAPYRKLLLSEITRQIEQSLGKGGAFYYENYRRGVKKHFSPAQFYLQPKGLSIYYQQYTIAPYSMGLPTFFIPYERLENLLRFDLTLSEE